MNKTLYELDYNLRQLDSVLSEAQDEESLEILAETRQTILAQVEEQATTILTYISDSQARAKHLKEEAVRIAKKAKALEKRADWLKDLLKTHLQDTGQQKATYGTYDVSLAKTPDRVVINQGEERWLPDDLCVITRTPNKTAIKDLIVRGNGTKLTTTVDGTEVELAHLESDQTIRIK